jgi:hypothetical protein
MFLQDGKATLNVELSIENDFEVDPDGNFHILTLIFVEDNDEPVEVRIRVEEVIENLLDFYRDGTPENNAGYQQLYSIANEFERHADRMREVAGYMEDRTIMGDLFDDECEPGE